MPLKIHGIPLHQFSSGEMSIYLYSLIKMKKMVPVASDTVLEY